MAASPPPLALARKRPLTLPSPASGRGEIAAGAHARATGLHPPPACPRESGGRPGSHDGEEGSAPLEDPLPPGEGRVRGRFRLRKRRAKPGEAPGSEAGRGGFRRLPGRVPVDGRRRQTGRAARRLSAGIMPAVLDRNRLRVRSHRLPSRKRGSPRTPIRGPSLNVEAHTAGRYRTACPRGSGGRPRQRSVCAVQAGREGRRWAPDRGPGRRYEDAIFL